MPHHALPSAPIGPGPVQRPNPPQPQKAPHHFVPPPRPVATQCTPCAPAGNRLLVLQRVSNDTNQLLSLSYPQTRCPHCFSALGFCLDRSQSLNKHTVLGEQKRRALDATHEDIVFRARGSPEAERTQAIFFRRIVTKQSCCYLLGFFFVWTKRFFGPCATDCYDARFSRARLNSTSISRFALSTCTETLW